MNKIIALLFCVLSAAILLSSCAGERKRTTQIVSGRILVDGNKPMAETEVKIHDLSDRWSPFGLLGPLTLAEGSTDKNGKFSVTVVDVKRFEKAQKKGTTALYVFSLVKGGPWVSLLPGDFPTYRFKSKSDWREMP